MVFHVGQAVLMIHQHVLDARQDVSLVQDAQRHVLIHALAVTQHAIQDATVEFRHILLQKAVIIHALLDAEPPRRVPPL